MGILHLSRNLLMRKQTQDFLLYHSFRLSKGQDQDSNEFEGDFNGIDSSFHLHIFSKNGQTETADKVENDH